MNPWFAIVNAAALVFLGMIAGVLLATYRQESAKPQTKDQDQP